MTADGIPLLAATDPLAFAATGGNHLLSKAFPTILGIEHHLEWS